MMISRTVEAGIRKRLQDQKAIILLGPRQVGKTTLLRQLFDEKDCLWLNGDDADTRRFLAEANAQKLKTNLKSKNVIIIDEAQRIENIGLCLKIITDQLPGVKVVATGSSSLELANRINEPLTGRKWEFFLFPFSFGEMVEHENLLMERRSLENRLIYGSYPEIVLHPEDAQIRLKSLADSYLFKDIFNWDRILKPERLDKLLQALAFQIGSEVSYNELSRTCGLDKETVEKYITLLEKTFVIFRLPSFSRNLRNELRKSRKIYFWDNGIRNAVINQFSPVSSRQDLGALWENYLVSERRKYLIYHQQAVNSYFWRTTAQQEIDYLEEKNGEFSVWEFKWNAGTRHRFPLTFMNQYKPVDTGLVHPDNMEDFLLSGFG
jgi:hypothetical protein